MSWSATDTRSPPMVGSGAILCGKICVNIAAILGAAQSDQPLDHVGKVLEAVTKGGEAVAEFRSAERDLLQRALRSAEQQLIATYDDSFKNSHSSGFKESVDTAFANLAEVFDQCVPRGQALAALNLDPQLIGKAIADAAAARQMDAFRDGEGRKLLMALVGLAFAELDRQQKFMNAMRRVNWKEAFERLERIDAKLEVLPHRFESSLEKFRNISEETNERRHREIMEAISRSTRPSLSDNIFILPSTVFEIYTDIIDHIAHKPDSHSDINLSDVYPRDPLVIMRGIEDAYDIDIVLRQADFSDGIEDHDDGKCSVTSIAMQFADDRRARIEIYVNSQKKSDGTPIVTKETLRVILVKQAVQAIIRNRMGLRGDCEGDNDITIDNIIKDIETEINGLGFGVKLLKPNVPVGASKAATILAIMLLVDVPELYGIYHYSLARDELEAMSPLRRRGRVLDYNNRISQYDIDKCADKYGIPKEYVQAALGRNLITGIVDGVRRFREGRN